MTLADLQLGMKATVTNIKLCENTRRRLTSVGLGVGAIVQYNRTAPLGDPMMFDVEDFLLALRRQDAAQIEVKPL